MKTALIFLASLAMSSANLVAQTGAIYSPTRVAASCPVTLRAQHLSDGDLVNTATAHPKGVGQALHLSMTNDDHGSIAEATILVRGFSSKGRLSQAADNVAPDASRQQHIHLLPTANESIADLWIPGLTAITQIEIVSVTYADGSTFNPSEKLGCRVTPDLVMPVHP